MLERRFLPILAVNLLVLAFFTGIFVARENWEFIFYVFVVIALGVLVFVSHRRVHYTPTILWGLTAWAFLHMAGGGLTWNGTRWYGLILWDIVGDPYHILKYDQVIHAFGFFVATLLAFHVLAPKLKEKKATFAVLFVVVMAGLGLGALNEIVEFAATVVDPNNGVGGYENTSLDLVADFLGALLAVPFLKRN